MAQSGSSTSSIGATLPATETEPRLGLLGVGWIGRHRLEALIESGCARCVVLADPAEKQLQKARSMVPEATCCTRLDELLVHDLDGVVIATPSALHARQAIRVLEAGVPVFCQKPLGRTADEVQRVIAAARRADRLLGVDMSYRHVEGIQKIKEYIDQGLLGEIYAAELTFHNAFGPDKDWFYDAERSGGGCVIDLGIHLVDLALWMLDFPGVQHVTSRLFAGGEPLSQYAEQVEDYATARIDFSTGGTANIICSWNLPAGQDAVINASFYGTEGGASLRNLNGSFFDFTAEHFDGTTRTTLATPPDAWGGRAITNWVRHLSQSNTFDSAIMQHLALVETVDAVYNR